jgi:hypothetical protein
MLFNLFGKKEEAPQSIFTDRCFMTTHAKLKACAALAKEQPGTIFICWFAVTLKTFKEYFTQQGLDEGTVMDAKNFHTALLQHKKAVFTEHHPLHSKELELVQHWPQESIIVYSAMDEPLFVHFGSEKMLGLMKLLGMKEDEVIEHSLVTKSIIKGQDKIAGMVELEQSAPSQKEWLEKNLKQ